MLASAPGSIGKKRPVSRSASLRLVERLARDAGLDGGGEVLGVDREHAVHLRKIDRDAALHGQQVAFERRPIAIGNDGYAILRAQLHDGLDLGGALRVDDGVGQLRIEARLVAAMMGAHGFGGGDALAERALQMVEEFRGKRAAGDSRRRGVIHAGSPSCRHVVLCGPFYAEGWQRGARPRGSRTWAAPALPA